MTNGLADQPHSVHGSGMDPDVSAVSGGGTAFLRLKCMCAHASSDSVHDPAFGIVGWGVGTGVDGVGEWVFGRRTSS